MAYPSSIDTIPTYAGTALMSTVDHAGALHGTASAILLAVQNVIGTTSGTSIAKNFAAGDFAATLAGTETLNNKIISTGSKLDANADSNFTYNSLARQAIINGNFDVWNRGTSIANTAANSYTADRWYVDTSTAGDDKTVSQQTAGVNGSLYSCRVQRVNGETGHTVLRLSQALESQDSIKFRGNKVTLSFYLKVGANFSASSNIFTAKILTGKGTDEKATAFTTSADAVSSDITATTTSVKYTCTTTAAIAADITQIGISFSYDPTGTAGANDWFEITQVQLCAGDVALPFMPKSYAQEKQDCSRYCIPFYADQTASRVAMGFAADTTHAYINFPFPTEMRAVPTLTATATDWALSDDTTNTDVTVMAILGNINQKTGITVYCTVASGLTAFRPMMLQADGNAGRLIYFSAEL